MPSRLEPRWAGMEFARGLPPSPANLDRVCRQVGPEAARWAFAQWELRSKAKAKFARADEMLFTREALEQATTESVATFHATLFPEDVLVADLTTGIGGDLIALARRGPVIGFERDSERAAMARHNLQVYGFGPTVPGAKAEIFEEDCLEAPVTWEYAIADPARRVDGRRTLDPSEFAPEPIEIASRFCRLRLGVIKLSPLLADGFLESLGPGLLFVSQSGECREALVILGQDAVQERAAVRADTGERLLRGPDPVTTDEADAYFYDADPAAVRAHALGTLCKEHGLKALGDSWGYLTGPERIHSPWLRAYQVLNDGKADLALTRRLLKEFEAGTPELKQRHAGQDLDVLRKQLRLEGTRKLSLAIWPKARSLRHTILEPLEL